MAIEFATVLETAMLTATGLFAGGAVMQSAVDHPVRMAVPAASGLDQMQRVLGRADPLMPILALIGTFSGVGLGFYGYPIAVIVAAITLFLVVPLTIIWIVPINRTMLSLNPANADGNTVSRLLGQWARLHLLRSILGTAALVIAIGSLR